MASQRLNPLTTLPSIRHSRPLPRMDVDGAHKLLHRLLAEAGLTAYRIEPDQTDGSLSVFAIDSAADGGWKKFHVTVDNTELHEVSEDLTARLLLVARLARALTTHDH